MALFNPRIIQNAVAGHGPIPPHHLSVLANWAAKVRDGTIETLN